jgi:two-component system chemotaxis sensor kinase CheA
LISAEQAACLSDREAINLIFLPGFSTAEKVTNLSGRGVGMDVVKINIEQIGGTVEVQSKPGQGTTFKITLPLTLAIIPALTITSNGDQYAIPQASLLELVRLKGEEASKNIERVHGAPVYRLRGNLLPIIYLNYELSREKTQADNAQDSQEQEEAINIVVLQADARQFGLVVEAINDTQEIVVKPLSKHLKDLSVFAGATIMGDGKVTLILDVLGIAQRAGVVSEVRDRVSTEQSTLTQEAAENRQTLLLCRCGENKRMAIPLSQVTRLEEFPFSKIEQTGGQEVVQYRGQIMPLIRPSQTLGGVPDALTGPIQVVVSTYQGRSIGLIVDHILDIVEETITMQSHTPRPGLLGSVVIQQRVTDLLDVPEIISGTGLTVFAQEEVA